MAYSAYQNEWKKANTIQVAFRISRNTDPELFDMLENTESKAGLIRQLCVEALQARQKIFDTISEK